MLIPNGRPKGLVLGFARLGRSTYYYQRHLRSSENHRGGRPLLGWSPTVTGQQISDEAVKSCITAAIAGDGVHYGYLRLTCHLRRQYGLVINKKKVYRLCKELNALHLQRRTQVREKRKLARNRVVTGAEPASRPAYHRLSGHTALPEGHRPLHVLDRHPVTHHPAHIARGPDVVGGIALDGHQIGG